MNAVAEVLCMDLPSVLRARLLRYPPHFRQHERDSPCVIRVLSNATTGLPSACACATSGATSMGSPASDGRVVVVVAQERTAAWQEKVRTRSRAVRKGVVRSIASSL